MVLSLTRTYFNKKISSSMRKGMRYRGQNMSPSWVKGCMNRDIDAKRINYSLFICDVQRPLKNRKARNDGYFLFHHDLAILSLFKRKWRRGKCFFNPLYSLFTLRPY